MTKERAIPESATRALRSNVGMVCRHDSKGGIEQLCMATRLGDGLWATVHDRGVYEGRVYGTTRGTRESVDLHLHFERDGERIALPVLWTSYAPIEPLAFLSVPGDRADAPEFVGAAEMVAPDYRKIYVPGPMPKDGDRFFGPMRASDIDMDAAFEAKAGAVFGPPRQQNYRGGASDAHRVGTPSDDSWGERYESASRALTVCVQGDMDHSRDGVLGAPVSDDAGRIVGIVIGAGLGNQSDHIGAYMPIDMILPLAAVAKALQASTRHRGCYTSRVDYVSHESTEVDFD